ncbi:hypothetical protein [Pseudophaeobacter sp.]|uniref:hypothetical protein n=1 Tax=Pseudophaeobacter sp. TaxID=1971739 RepID=UPI00329A5FFB
MDDVGKDIQKLIRDQKTWERTAIAFALSGPYGSSLQAQPNQLNARSTLSFLRALFTTRVVLCDPPVARRLSRALDACAQAFPQDLVSDPAANAKQRHRDFNEVAIPGGRVKASVNLASNIFYGFGDTLGCLLTSLRQLHIEQGSSEAYAASAHTTSEELLTGHPSSEAYQQWLSRSNSEANGKNGFGSKTSFGVVRYLREEAKWSFWLDWYASFLDGKPLDWELQRRVALIEDAIWEAGPEAVAKEIARIQAGMLAEKLPMAERIEVNPDTGKFRAIAILVENPATLSALLSQIEDALEDCLGGHNGLAERSGTVKKLNRVLTKYKDDPQNAELTLTRVAGSLRGQLHDTRDLPDNEENLALLNAVEEGVRGIRANHPEVAKNREQLAQQAIHALTPEDKDLLQQALPVLAEISEPELAGDFETDIPELINDALLPLPDAAPPLPGADVTTRIFSRVSKMALLIQNGKDLAQKGAEAFDSDVVKSIRLAGLAISVMGGIGGILFALVKVGLNILGVL